jgi:CO/xanthine dehydrogenase Mo-binding subunit
LAQELKKDPVQFRLELLEKAQKSPSGNVDYNPARFIGVIKLIAEKAEWGKQTPGIYRGFAAYYCHNSYAAAVADVIMIDGRPKVKKVFTAADCGVLINKSGADSQCMGCVVDAIGHGLYGKLTLTSGVPDQRNFSNYQLGLMADAPEVESWYVESKEAPTGLGEPPFPAAFGAVANALSMAIGKRLYKQPFSEELSEGS